MRRIVGGDPDYRGPANKSEIDRRFRVIRYLKKGMIDREEMLSELGLSERQARSWIKLYEQAKRPMKTALRAGEITVHEAMIELGIEKPRKKKEESCAAGEPCEQAALPGIDEESAPAGDAPTEPTVTVGDPLPTDGDPLPEGEEPEQGEDVLISMLRETIDDIESGKIDRRRGVWILAKEGRIAGFCIADPVPLPPFVGQE